MRLGLIARNGEDRTEHRNPLEQFRLKFEITLTIMKDVAINGGLFDLSFYDCLFVTFALGDQLSQTIKTWCLLGNENSHSVVEGSFCYLATISNLCGVLKA